MKNKKLCFKIAIVSFIIITNVCGVSSQTYVDKDRCYEEAMVYVGNAKECFSNGQWDDAIENYNKALQTFESCGDEYGKAITLMDIGVVYAHKNELDSALRYLQDSYNIFQNDAEIDDNEIATLGNMGNVFVLREEWGEALESYNKALSLSEERNDTHGMAFCMDHIGDCYCKMGNYSAAIESHLQAADLFNKSGDLREAGNQFKKVGICYFLSGEFEKSLDYYDDAEYFFGKINDTGLINELSYYRGWSYCSFAIYHRRLESFDESLKYSELALSESIKAQRTYPNGFFVGANALLEMGDVYSLQGDHKNATDSYRKALYFLDDYGRESEKPNGDFCNGFTTLISAKISFEEAIIQTEKLNYEEAANLFNDSAEKVKSILRIELFSYDKLLLEGYYHYSMSKKNYFLFKSTGNRGYNELSENELRTAKGNFNEYGAPELARICVKDKLINYPYLPILHDEYVILIRGLSFDWLLYPKELVTSEIGYIKFNYQYCLDIPPEGLPAIKFCCDDFCSDWIRIKDNENREVTIKVKSDTPTKVSGDIKIYGEDKPDEALGNIEDSYWPSFLLELAEVETYGTVDIIIKKPLFDRIKDSIEIIAIVFTILGISLFKIIPYTKSRKKEHEYNIKPKNKRHKKVKQSNKKK